jgi:hypothetical protein
MRVITVVLAGALLAFAAVRSQADAAKESDFFNGKDLTGWEGLTQYWSVKDGALVGDAGPDGLKHNTFLCSKKKYGDFELKFQIRLKDGKGNSGVQIRSAVMERKHFTVKGPQADIGEGFWASLYGEHFGDRILAKAPEDVIKRVLKPPDFNDYHIKCVGKHITIKLNGETTVDTDVADMPGVPELPATGIIAFQLHAGGPMIVTFRNIQFTDLSKK